MASLKTRAVKFFGIKLTCTNRRKVSSSLCLGIFKAVTISKCPQCYQEGKGSEEKKRNLYSLNYMGQCVADIPEKCSTGSEVNA